MFEKKHLVGLLVALVLIAPVVLLGIIVYSPSHPGNTGDQAVAPHVHAYEVELEINRQESKALELRRRIRDEKFQLLVQRTELLQNDMRRAHSNFQLAIDSAFAKPREKAEKLISDLRLYNADSASYEARADLSIRTAGYLGAIGAQPLSFPQRNYAYLDNLHDDALRYVQAVKALKSDTEAAKLSLESEITRIQNEFVSLQVSLRDVAAIELDNDGLERIACEKALALVKSLGPFLTNELVPDAPLPSVENHDVLRSQNFDDVADWMANARVDADAFLLTALNDMSLSLFIEANELVERLAKRGEP